MLGGGIITSHKKAWDHVGLTAALRTWHHVAMVYDGAKLHFWHNGKPEKHAAYDKGNMVRKNNPLFIGQAGTGTSREYFVGLVDEVRIYTKALSTAEVGKDCGCKAVAPPKPPAPARASGGLEAWYRFEGNAKDSSGKNRHGKWQ